MDAGVLVRVTVASGTRRVDLALPGTVPVAELVPELARSVGLLDAATAHGGYRLVTAGGRALASDGGLVHQGVADGAVLTVAAGADDPPPRVYDDEAEAMADVVERDLAPWEPAAARRTGLAAAVLLAVLGAGALLTQRGSPSAGLATAGLAVALVAGALVSSRLRPDPVATTVGAWLGILYAATAAAMLASGGTLPGSPGVAAAAASTGAGAACLVGLGAARTLALPPVVAGLVLLVDGLVLRELGVPPAVGPTVVLVLVVVLGGVLPRLAVGAGSALPDRLEGVGPVDPDRVAADARTAHEILVAVSASIGLLLVLTAPLAVSLGRSGAVVAVACCAVVMLRARSHRAGAQVLVGLVAGVLGLAATAVAALRLEPSWRPAVAALLVGAGVATLAWSSVVARPSVRRRRWGDLAETAALLALPPLLLVATGVLSAVRR